MRFQLSTLIDITKTDARRGDDLREQLQQQNFYTALQTISLRANPTIEQIPQKETVQIENLGFGSEYTGKHEVWSWQFSFEQADSHNIEFLVKDFNLVPVILDLDETVILKDAVFITKDLQFKNVTFVLYDK